ncbi:MAG: xanthine dehydrogenase family protein molybdopterin-binding subunit, partial [Methyloligellaceae bacterium]
MSGRREDHRLLSGAGRYVADLTEEGMVYGAVHRSSYAHAEIEHIDLERARSMPGVLAIFTADDLNEDGIDNLPCGVELPRPNGEKAFQARRRILADNRVRFVGEPVAFVVAETSGEAMDASELVDVRYKELPVVATLDEALSGSSKNVWTEVPDNVAFVWERGDRAKADAALSAAAHTISFEDHISRVTAAPIEPRGCLGFVDPQGRLTLKIANQSPFALANALSGQLGVARDQVHIIAGDLGGSFGMKSGAYPEDVLVLWAARKIGTPVKWIAERREDLLADDHGRDIRFTSKLALDETGAFLGLKVQLEIDIGCYLSGRSTVCLGNMGGISGVYMIPAVSAEARGIFTNKHMTAPYRGAGRPEATFIIERTIDAAARELSIDPYELRFRNLIPNSSMPFDTGFLFNYDCGDFPANMSTARQLSQYDTFPDRRSKARDNGRLRGIGFSNPIEVAGGPFVKPMGDHTGLSLQVDGTWELKPGAMSTGQGLETAFSDIVADRLGLRPEQITYR